MGGSRWVTPGRVLYGRGAVDMKGALASMAWTGAALLLAGVGLDGELVLVANTMEKLSEAESINCARQRVT